jgi:hypothetical protein
MTKNRTYSLDLKFFDINMISDDSIVVFIGRRRTGKSYCLRDLLYNNRDIPYGTIISATENASPFFQEFIPSTYISTEFKETMVADIIKRQQKIKELKMSKNPKYANIDPRILLVLDDCLYDDSWSKTTEIRNIFMNGRHYNIFFMLTMQYPLGVPPALRTNIDYTIIMREPYMSNRKRIYENFASMFPSFQIFCKAMDSLDKHECLVVCNNADSSKLEDQVFWYKARDTGQFKFGCKQYWENHDKEVRRQKKLGENSKKDGSRNISEYEKGASRDKFIINKRR